MAFLSCMHRIMKTSREPVPVLFAGLDAAGKTTILYSLSGKGDGLVTIPTIGFNVETIDCKPLGITAWDIGGGDKSRTLMRHYFEGTRGLIFVVDSSDRERLPTARKELKSMLCEEELREVPLLLFANKQDKSGAMTVAEVQEGMELAAIRGRSWHAQGSCATASTGLEEGIDWLSTTIAGEWFHRLAVKEDEEDLMDLDREEHWGGKCEKLKGFMRPKFWLSLLHAL